MANKTKKDKPEAETSRQSVKEASVESEEMTTEEAEAQSLPEEEAEAEETPDPQKQIDDLNNQVALLKNAYAKAYADTENTKKRLSKEYENLAKYQIQNFAMQILPVMDDCERALSYETTDEVYRKGVEMIYSKLQAALKSEGITEIEALNQPFDANWHQALMSEHVEGVEPGMVTEVLQKGYKLKDRLLRAAVVKVSE